MSRAWGVRKTVPWHGWARRLINYLVEASLPPSRVSSDRPSA